ncbi:endonuclease/exonuclease/phosphatase family protein [Flammeovirga pectinis]|uniref:Endonuclease/exonuclease/phosphatase family protein n=1 Tax=Flammeovirga pectinis TaxID=2494373 RepID=A0A3S9P0B3_9BACT|nr:endonuclease/exonuclease/phosphatase family protein [Flammeovirga pectinis]AZQ61622.1 endonuclease/exonuclease/phosphatase family protein [Flammeovirga pectinis]
MKNTIILLFLLLGGSIITQAQDKSINMMSFNIRMNTPNDGENAWPNRKDWVADVIKFNKVDILGTQEVLLGQLNDLKKSLPEMTAIGVGRDDGKEGGEFSSIFFNTHKFKLIDSGTFWLSETPEKPSKGWDAALPRVCTWVKLKHKASKRTLVVMNTHYDHMGAEARVQSSKLISKKAQEMAENGKVPVVLMGDLNSIPTSAAVLELQGVFQDTRPLSLLAPLGPTGTFQAFDYNSDLIDQIDYIMVHGYFKVVRYAHITEARDHKFPSDHLPVFVELQ